MTTPGFQIVRPIKVIDAVLASSSVPEDDYGAYNAGTTYASGAFAISPATHRIYRSLKAGNTGNPLPVVPATATEWWQDVGATNRWKMFDGSVESQTNRADSIAIELLATGRANTVCIFNASGASIQIEMEDAVDGVVYDKTFSLVSNSGITDAYAYCFEPIERLADLVVDDLPPYANATVRVTISDPGNTVKCGACIIGQSKRVGSTQFGARVGIQDYSLKQRDAFGNTTVLERSYNKRTSLNVIVDNSFVDHLVNLLAKYRATPVVYIGTGLYSSTIAYGFYEDFDVEIAWTTESLLSINIKGLT